VGKGTREEHVLLGISGLDDEILAALKIPDPSLFSATTSRIVGSTNAGVGPRWELEGNVETNSIAIIIIIIIIIVVAFVFAFVFAFVAATVVGLIS
jgi:hypothetical protein